MTKVKVFTYCILPAILILAGCNQQPGPEKLTQSMYANDTVGISKKATITPITDTVREPESFTCIRGQAEPIIDTLDYPNTVFKLIDSISATETVRFDNGDQLIITNTGCEYYVLRFRFETTRFAADTNDLKYWYKAAGTLVTGMLGGINASSIDIKRGLVYLSSYAESNSSSLKLNEEIEYENYSVVTLEQIEKLSNKRYAVIICFYTGPL